MHDGLGLVGNVPMIINEEEWNYYIRLAWNNGMIWM